MSFLCAARPSRAQLLLLPPSIRASVYQNTLPRRHLSASAPRSGILSEAAITIPTAILDGIHSLGCPWWAAIPLSAALVRCTLLYYVSARPARKREITRTYLHGLATITSAMHTNNATAKLLRERTPTKSELILRGMVDRFWGYHKLGKKFKAPIFTWTGPLNFFTMLAFAEAIRVKCGSREGLLAMIFRPFEDMKKAANDSGTPTLNADEALAQRLEAHYDQIQAAQNAKQIDGASSEDLSPLEPFLVTDDTATGEAVAQSYNLTTHLPKLPAPPTAYAEHADPTMMTEGIAWIHDLTVPDPNHVLPFVFAAIILSGVNWKNVAKKSSIHQRPESRDKEASKTSIVAPTLKSAPTSPAQDAQLDHQRKINSEITAALKQADELRKANADRKFDIGILEGLSLGDRMKLFIALALFSVSLKMPVGIVLYIVTNSIMGKLQKRWLDMKYPLPDVIRSCRRPMRFKVRKEFRDV